MDRRKNPDPRVADTAVREEAFWPDQGGMALGGEFPQGIAHRKLINHQDFSLRSGFLTVFGTSLGCRLGMTLRHSLRTERVPSKSSDVFARGETRNRVINFRARGSSPWIPVVRLRTREKEEGVDKVCPNFNN